MAQKEGTSQNISRENQGKKPNMCHQLTDDKSAKDTHLGKDGPLNKLLENNITSQRTLDTVCTALKTSPDPQFSTSSPSSAGSSEDSAP